MLKRREGIDKEVALKKACEMNGIQLSPKYSNQNPVSYIDSTGVKRGMELSKKSQETSQPIPIFNVGDIVRVYGKIKEGNREKTQVFEGVVLKKQGGGAREIFTVRKNINGISIAKTWSLHSSNVERVEVVHTGKVSRAKLNHLRGRVGKKVKVKKLVN